MAYEWKEGNVNILRNERKQEGDKLPNYTGKCMVDGKMKDISLWIKEGERGRFFSGQIKEAYVKPTNSNVDDMLEEKPGQSSEEPVIKQGEQDDSSDLPF